MREPVYDLHLYNILLGCAHEQKAHGTVDDRCGYGGQQKGTIVMLTDRVHVYTVLNLIEGMEKN